MDLGFQGETPLFLYTGSHYNVHSNPESSHWSLQEIVL